METRKCRPVRDQGLIGDGKRRMLWVGSMQWKGLNIGDWRKKGGRDAPEKSTYSLKKGKKRTPIQGIKRDIGFRRQAAFKKDKTECSMKEWREVEDGHRDELV